ncbi:hypothetical protein O181_125214 [Austropuccinia psidii MF-1]|uniref:Uncharacterized protein n=1 Tax=Austropuccinia psidii MF-1 TaxID=1389203 RepID=A0A9Q3Q501_9BASI|nr:hypothetical protein [Austropuccinia psidii MF-1]
MGHSEWDNTILPSKRADTPTPSLLDIYKASPSAYKNALQLKEYQILADPWKNCMNSYLTVRKFLRHPNTFKLLNGWHPFMEKKNMMLLRAEWRKKHSTSKESTKNSPSGQQQQFQNEEAATNSKQGKREDTISKTLQPRLQDAMENVFQMARTMMELQKKDEDGLKYQKLFLILLIIFQSCIKLLFT